MRRKWLVYRMHVWLVLIFMIGLADIHLTQGCKSSSRLLNYNVSADLAYGSTVYKYDKLAYAKLNNDKAFCAWMRNGFYIQVSFGGLRRITEVKIQGFKVNGTNYKINAFQIKFSLDGHNWYNYYKDNRYFLVDTGNTNYQTEAHVQLPKAPIGKYVRLFPKNLRGVLTEKIMCIRFELYGCDKVLPAIVKSPPIINAPLNKNIQLSCSATGMYGMTLSWKDEKGTQKNVTELRKRLIARLQLKLSYSHLHRYNCIGHTQNVSVSCSQQYTCRSAYTFDPTIQSESYTKVHVNILLPERIKYFSTTSKNRSGVLVSWKRPKLNDVPSSMLSYSFTCNFTGSKVTVLLPLSVTSKFLKSSRVYHACQCAVRVVRMRDNSTRETFPVDFKQQPAMLNFRTLSIRPDVKPSITVKQQRTSDGAVKIQANCNFTNKDFGQPSGFQIDAKQLMYATRDPEHSLVQDVKQTVTVRNVRGGYISSRFLVRGLKPWSKYSLEVSVFNDDMLYSNISVKKITTDEGKPMSGPSLKVISRVLSTHVTIGVASSSPNFTLFHHNGELVSYQLINLNTNKTFREENLYKNLFEVTGLTPNTEYLFQCKAATKAGFGPYGEILTITTSAEKPTQPFGVSFSINHLNFLTITWSEPTGPGGTITKYEFYIILYNNTFIERTKEMKPQDTRLVYSLDLAAREVREVRIRAYTSAGAGDFSIPYPVSFSNNRVKEESTLIIGFSIAFGAFAVFVVLCFVYFRRHYRSQPRRIKEDYPLDPMLNSREVHVFDDELESEMYFGSNHSSHSDANSYILVSNTHDPLSVDAFPDYINQVKQEDYKTLLEDFKNQMPLGKCYSWNVSDLPENMSKNRYQNICAYDHSRIVLKQEGERKNSDYVNANSIYSYKKVEDGKYQYISTQGPVEDTVPDFWQMVWQEGSSIIVMLTNLKENDKVKCCQYWPNESTKLYGKIEVTLDKIDKTADYITRTFRLEHVESKEQRTVRQFHFVPWPDHGVPDYPTALLSLRRRVRHYYDGAKPLIVHCSAGVGRTGAFILIDAMLERIDNEKTVDIFNYLNYMRTRRICMVQTPEQYIFVHTAILEYITFGNTETFVGELDKKFKELVRGNGMADEFAVLERNKLSDVRPGNTSKVYLREGMFVEAFHVDGFKQRDAFILTTAPSEANIVSLWKMVLEKQCHTIVMLNKCQETKQEYYKYWPDVDGHNAYQDIAVMLNSEVANGNIITRKIKVTATNNRRCEVNHFQFVDWPDTDVPEEKVYNNICTLMQAVEKSQHNLGNGPIIVHSGNDYGRSGTFLAVYNSTERLKVEQLIDVLQCVRGIRIAQPLAVDNVDQYQFVYNMLRTYLEGFENYCNYKEYNACRSPFGSTSSSFVT